MPTNPIRNPLVGISVTGEQQPDGADLLVILLKFRGESGDSVTLCYDADKFAVALKNLTLQAEFGVRIINAIEHPESDPELRTHSDETGRFDISRLLPEDGDD